MLIERFEFQVKKQSNKIAVKSESGSLTYNELNLFAQRIAGSIKALQTDTRKPGAARNIGLLFDDSLNMIAAILGVLKSGGAYVPIVKDYPPKRIEYIAAHAELDAFITDKNNLDMAAKAVNNRNTRFITIEEIENHSPAVQFNPVTNGDYNAYLLYTSGSTGRPKGVVQTQRNILYYIDRYVENLNIDAADRLTHFPVFTHDASVVDLYSALLSGATLFPLDLKKGDRFSTLAQWLKQEEITIFHSVPTVFRYFVAGLRDAPNLPRLRFIVLGGEAVYKSDVERFSALFPKARLYNLYGQTESTYNSGKFYYPGQPVGAVTLGKVNKGAQIFLVDKAGNEVDPLEVGEIVVACPHVSPGYFKAEEETSAKFIDDEENGRVYFTGDLGRLLIDGEIEYIKRKDDQIKIRGFRVEPGEIENVVLSYPYIKAVAAIPIKTAAQEIFIACYFSAVKNIDIEELRDFLGQSLADYMIPSYFKQLEKLPLTVSGKVDRKALPAPEMTIGEAYAAPATAVEKKLVEIWSGILDIGRDVIGADSNFFALGGHSLRATVLTLKIYQEFQVKVPLQEVFNRPTLRRLATYIEQAGKSEYEEIVPAEKKEYYPLSSAQKRLYLLQQLDQQGTGYNMINFFDIGDQADKQELETACTRLIQRHEILRTSFHVFGQEPVQRIHPAQDVEFALKYFELPDLPTSGAAASGNPGEYRDWYAAAGLIVENFLRSFDLAQAPLFRAALVKANGRYAFAIDIHHIAADNISLNLLEYDYLRLYDDKEIPRLNLHYKDYFLWQGRAQQKAELKKMEEYWLSMLGGELPVLDLPYDYPRPALQSFAGKTVGVIIEAEETRRLKELAQQTDTTLYMLLLAALSILLTRLSSQEEVLVGVPAAGRMHAQARDLIGMFVNTVVVRSFPIPGKPFLHFLQEVKQNLIAAYENQEYPFEDVVEKVSTHRNVGRNPLFDVSFNLIDERDYKGEVVEAVERNQVVYRRETSRFDLTMTATDRGPKFIFRFEYCTRLFKEETMAGIIRYLKYILQQLCENPGQTLGQIGLLSEVEKDRLLYEFNDTYREYPVGKTIQQLFVEQAEKYPDRIALAGMQPDDLESGRTAADRFDGLSYALTYRELDNESQRLASMLVSKGIKRDIIVGLPVRRSTWMITAILGILKAGGAYLPIDLDYPEERNRYMLADSGARFLVAARSSFNRDWTIKNWAGDVVFIEDCRGDSLCSSIPQCSPKGIAYIIYTSGTTGNPKGVMIEHSSLVNLCLWHNSNFAVTPADRAGQYAGSAFDASVWEIFPYLAAGVTLYIIPDEIKHDTEQVNSFLERNKITICFLPTQFCEYFMKLENNSLRILLTGGDKLRVFVPKKYLLYNNYGPTENTVVTTSWLVYEYRDNIPIGRPTANTRVYILSKDNFLNMQPIGLWGELCVAGAGLARGYLNNPELTAEKFIAFGESEPFCKKVPTPPKTFIKSFCGGPGGDFLEKSPLAAQNLYKTGDLARWLSDGNIEFLGRIDQQVKIRGFRIELGEIEARLLEHEKIREAAVIDRLDAAGEKYLCAYLAAQTISPPEIREYLSRSLPDYMIPQYYVLLDKIPLTANGKIDRKALPLPEITSGRGYTAPRTEIEKKLAATWSEVLKVDKGHIGINSNFFELGGHSLNASLVAALVHRELQVKIPLTEVFKRQTLRELAEYIAQAGAVCYTGINPVEEKEYYPLSSAQKRLYFIRQLDAANIAYNMPLALPLDNTIGAEKIEPILKKLIGRHESLRTSFIVLNNEPVQRIHHPSDIDFKIEYYDNLELDVVQRFVRPFDLALPPLLRSAIIELPDGNYTWLIDMHHIISDGTSQAVLTRDFMTLFADEELAPQRTRYKDFSKWQEKLFATGTIAAQENYWLSLLADAGEVPRLQLPADYSRPEIFTFTGDYSGFVLTGEEAVKFKALGMKYGATLFMNFLAALDVLFYKYTGDTDIIVGCSIAGRTQADLRSVIGMFVNTLVMRNFPCGDKTYESFLKEVIDNSIAAFENQDVQFESLVDKLDVARDTSRNPFFDISILQQNFETPGTSVEIPVPAGDNLSPAGIELRHTTTKFDMTFFISEQDEDIYVNIEYYTAVYRRETIERLASHFKNLIRVLINEPAVRLENIEIISADEKKQVLYEFNDTYSEYPFNKTIRQLFIEQVEKNPDRAALIGFEQEAGKPVLYQVLTYRRLYDESQKLADNLQAKGVEPDSIVGLMVERSSGMIIGILGILLAGSAYLPIEMGYPAERISYMLADSGARFLVTQRSSFDKEMSIKNRHGDVVFISCRGDSLWSPDSPGGRWSPTKFSKTSCAESIAYVIYTSGTTGKPKGVLAQHYNVTRVVRNNDYIEITPHDNILQLSNYAFDGSVFDIYGALLNGAKLVLAAQSDIAALDRLGEIIRREYITVFFVTTALFNTLVDLEIGSLAGVRKMLFGGERVSVEHSRRALKNLGTGKIIHVYGPTETTVYATYYFIDEIDDSAVTVPIGRPLANTQAYILDRDLKPLPVGVNGEIYIGGCGNARGYLNNPELTAERFVASGGQGAFLKNRPLHPQKTFDRSFCGGQGGSFLEKRPLAKSLYKTGDLARWLRDGNIEFLGRIDQQVKVRGFRIELGEIENRLLEHKKINAAVVIDRQDTNGEKYLCAYLAGQDISSQEIKEYLSRSLPDYMIPQYFIMLDKIPLTPNGKLDRRALPTPEISVAEAYTAPRNGIEKKLAAVWAETLNIDIEKIGIDSNFFKLGGHSLKAAVMTAKIYKELGVRIPIAELFKNSSIRGLSGSIAKSTGEKFNRMEPVEKKEYYELSFNQKRLWIIQQRNRDDNSYNMPSRIIMDHKVDETVICKTTAAIINLHESLRIGFREIAGQAVQYVIEKYELPFSAVDLSGLPAEQQEIKLKKILSEFELKPFHLEQPPLFRVLLIKTAEDRWIFSFNMHHIISDGWSMGILERDFRNIYNGYLNGGAGPGELHPIAYKDFAARHNRQLADAQMRKLSHQFWLAFLSRELPLLRLPGGRAGAGKTKLGASYRFVIPGAIKEALKNQGSERNITLFSFLYSIYIIFLAQLAGQPVVVSSIVNAGRDHAVLLDIVGFFVNAVPFRKEVDFEEVFIDFAGKVQAEVFDFFKYQNYPLELVLEEVGRKYPDIAASFNMVNVLSNENLALDNMDSYHKQGMQNVKFEIELYVSEYSNGVEINAAYNRELFKADDVAFMMTKYSKLAEFFALHPFNRLKDYKEERKKKVVVKTNMTAVQR